MKTTLFTRFFIAALLIVPLFLISCSRTDPSTKPFPGKEALLVLDLQQDFLGQGARLPIDPRQVAGIEQAAQELTKAFREKNLPVVFIKNGFSHDDIVLNFFRNNASLKGSPGAQWIGPAEQPDIWIEKNQSNAFSQAQLLSFLEKAQVDTLVILGVFADPFACVPSTAGGGIEHGFHTIIVSDGVGTAKDPDKVPALKSMENTGSTVRTSSEILLALGEKK